MTPGRRAIWIVYAVLLLALGAGRTIEKVVADSGGFMSRYGPALGGGVVAAGVVAHCLASNRVGARVWAALFALTLVAALGLLVLEATLLTVSSAPARVHGLVVGGALLLLPALIAFARRARQRA